MQTMVVNIAWVAHCAEVMTDDARLNACAPLGSYDFHNSFDTWGWLALRILPSFLVANKSSNASVQVMLNQFVKISV